MPQLLLLATLDTKLHEALFLHEQLQAAARRLRDSALRIVLIDIGRSPIAHPAIAVTHSELLGRYDLEQARPHLASLHRGDVIRHVAGCAQECVRRLVAQGDVHAVVSLGGSGGTSLASQVMRQALPLGMPKLIVSTVASGDVGPYVGETDLAMMYSVVDICGMNATLSRVLGNAAGAAVGMAAAYGAASTHSTDPPGARRKRVGITMFGVTTPCAERARRYLQNHDIEVFVFHATGRGGQSMERMVTERQLDAVLDLTTTEICDFVADGNMSAGPRRLESALAAGIPNVISLGATDMVNFGPKSSVPEAYLRDQRKFMEHNPSVTLMRTNPSECRKVGEFIVEKVFKYAKRPGMVQVWIPKGGVSVVSTPGAIFHDAEADAALIDALHEGFRESNVKVIDDQRSINDEQFAVEISESLLELIAQAEGNSQ